jgi:tetratricopeptide (TPR) repeat protein
MNRHFTKALEYYEKAIALASADTEGVHVFHCNKAASLIELERFEEALVSATTAVEMKPDYVKAYIRKAEAERELLKNDEALATLEKALELEEANPQLTELYEEHKTEWEDDHSVAPDDPNRLRFDKLEQWLSEGGSKYDKLKIRFYTPIYRGVHAAKNIKAGEEILLIPKEQIITLEMAFESPIGRKMMEHNLRSHLLSPKHSFLTTYIL